MTVFSLSKAHMHCDRGLNSSGDGRRTYRDQTETTQSGSERCCNSKDGDTEREKELMLVADCVALHYPNDVVAIGRGLKLQGRGGQ
jgi:hypothetical protein